MNRFMMLAAFLYDPFRSFAEISHDPDTGYLDEAKTFTPAERSRLIRMLLPGVKEFYMSKPAPRAYVRFR